ncbi:chaplin family protein [Streptomyces microflavus]|uniref:chaplin family protein n=1 Tax=Streptomyces microflavus TaxID=1919 RepID=UPI003330A0DE
MSRETRSTGARAIVLGAVTGAALLPAGTAEANVVGVGNAAFGNACANHADARAEGATVAGSGLGSGNHAGLPLNLARNHCGNSGIICTAIFMARY